MGGGRFLGDVPGVFKLCVSEWQQDGGHRSSRVFNLHSLSCPIYPSVFAVSAHLRSLVSLSPFFAFPLSPPPRDGWGKKNNVEGGWEEAKRHSSVPCQMSKNKSPEKTDRARLTLLSGVVKVGGPSDEIVLLSARVCVYVCLCDPPLNCGGCTGAETKWMAGRRGGVK